MNTEPVNLAESFPFVLGGVVADEFAYTVLSSDPAKRANIGNLVATVRAKELPVGQVAIPVGDQSLAVYRRR